METIKIYPVMCWWEIAFARIGKEQCDGGGEWDEAVAAGGYACHCCQLSTVVIAYSQLLCDQQSAGIVGIE